MHPSSDTTPIRRVSPWRLAGWGLAAGLLVLPAVAMQFTDEVNWSVSDFIFMGVLFALVGGALELAVRSSRSLSYRLGIGVTLLGTFLLIWINGAVGIIGSEDNPANLWYVAVLGVGLVGAFVSLFRPYGMARTMLAVTAAQVAVALAALAFGWGASGPIWPRDVIGVTGMFVTLWVIATGLFLKAAQEVTEMPIE